MGGIEHHNIMQRTWKSIMSIITTFNGDKKVNPVFEISNDGELLVA